MSKQAFILDNESMSKRSALHQHCEFRVTEKVGIPHQPCGIHLSGGMFEPLQSV